MITKYNCLKTYFDVAVLMEIGIATRLVLLALTRSTWTPLHTLTFHFEHQAMGVLGDGRDLIAWLQAIFRLHWCTMDWDKLFVVKPHVERISIRLRGFSAELMLWGLLHSTDWFQKTGPILAQLPHVNSHTRQIFFSDCYRFFISSRFAENALCWFASQRNCIQVDSNAGFAVAIVPRGGAAGQDYHRR